MSKRRGPVVIDLEDEGPPAPALAPAVPDEGPPPGRTAMERFAVAAARPPSRLGQAFRWLLSLIVTFGVSLWAWRFVSGLVAAHPVLGWFAAALIGAFVVVCLALAVREAAAFARLRRLDRVHRLAEAAAVSGDLAQAGLAVDAVLALYAGRADLEWGRARVLERRGEVFDADGLLGLVEVELLAALDAQARREIEAAARQLAVVTAVVPLALADVATALAVNVRMIRRIATIYGGRTGTFGNWRLVRSVLAHLVATGAVAAGDDLVHTVAGGGLLAKVSRRFGEGVVNAALTSRVGVVALEVCRPMPFIRVKKPSTSALLQRALAGLFGR